MISICLKPVWSDQEWLDGRSFIDPNILPWKGGAGPNLAGTEYLSKWNWSGLESIPMSDEKKIIVCMSPFNPREYSQVGSTVRLIFTGSHQRKFENRRPAFKCSLNPDYVARIIGEQNSNLYTHLIPTTTTTTTTTSITTTTRTSKTTTTTNESISTTRSTVMETERFETTNQLETIKPNIFQNFFQS